MIFSPTDAIHLAQAGGVGLAICLLLVGLLLVRGTLEWGSAVARERDQARERLDREKQWSVQMQKERDDFKAQVESRQQAVEQALAVAQAQLQNLRGKRM